MSELGKVSVAVLSWNGLEHLKICLEALRQQDDPGVPWEVLVLDNGSVDGSAAWVREHHPQVRLLSSERNLGFCAGNNRLVREADGDAVAFLNNDARPHPSWLSSLTRALASAGDDAAAVSGTILDWGGERLDFAQGVMTFDGHAFQKDYHKPLPEARVPETGADLFFPCGGNMLIRRQAFLDVGGFDEDYFAYLEDVDLGWRLWARGYRVQFVSEAVVCHRSMATSDLLGLYNRGFLFERNAFLTAYKNYEGTWWDRLMPAILLTLLSRAQTLLVENNPGGKQLSLDPYAGLIANTRPAQGNPSNPGSTSPLPQDLRSKWRNYGPWEFLRRGLFRARRTVSSRWTGKPANEPPPLLSDPRTVAQFRSLSYVLRHLDDAAAKREAVQARRRRSDQEIFERFPLYLVPTYPGDEVLFASAGFSEWLPDDLPLVRCKLGEIMHLG